MVEVCHKDAPGPRKPGFLLFLSLQGPRELICCEMFCQRNLLVSSSLLVKIGEMESVWQSVVMGSASPGPCMDTSFSWKSKSTHWTNPERMWMQYSGWMVWQQVPWFRDEVNPGQRWGRGSYLSFRALNVKMGPLNHHWMLREDPESSEECPIHMTGLPLRQMRQTAEGWLCHLYLWHSFIIPFIIPISQMSNRGSEVWVVVLHNSGAGISNQILKSKVQVPLQFDLPLGLCERHHSTVQHNEEFQVYSSTAQGH